MRLFVVKQYIKIYRLIQKYFGLNIKGLGYMLDKIDKDFIFEVENKKFYFNNQIARSYSVMINGSWIEPETHLFVNSILNLSSENIDFIDVGANIGEMVFDFSHHENIGKVIAIEPNPEAVEALRKTKEINNLEFVDILGTVATDKKQIIEFPIDMRSPTGSSMYTLNSKDFLELESITIDEITQQKLDNDRLSILLIDVEGYEKLVLEGAKYFISSNKPLIIFEYNLVSKQHFNLDDIQRILPSQYEIFRLNSFAKLDKNFDDTWNCVAINKDSVFYDWCKLLDKQG